MEVTDFWKGQPGSYFFLSTKDRKGNWEDHSFRKGHWKRVQKFIADNNDKDLYWCVHGFTRPRRLKRCAMEPHWAYADLDEVNPRELSDLMPTVAIQTSPGRYHGWWDLGDDFLTWELNRRLTYHLGADHGGWDPTQVLRIPGTVNYKYPAAPKVKLLWEDGPIYSVRKLTRMLPRESAIRTEDKGIAAGLYKKYEPKLTPWTRRTLFKGKAQRGKRSEVLWKLNNELLEAGVPGDDIFELIRASHWNKFATRRNGDEQLRRELDKAMNKHFRVVDDIEYTDNVDDDEEEVEDESDYKYLARSMEDVEEENIDWLWYPYLAKGEVTIVEGDPDVGKSYLMQMVSAAIVDRSLLPSVKKVPRKKGKVAYFDMENSSGTVTKKRLLDNGCVNLKWFFQEEQPFSIDDDEEMDKVYDAVEELRPSLCVFDTLNTYMGGANTNTASEVQQTFKYFVDIARRFKCAVVVLRHLTKDTKRKAMYRGQGSIAFTGLARIVLTVGKSPDDDDTRVIAVSKCNVARKPKALTYAIQSLPDELKRTDRSRFIWGKFVDLSADEIVARPTEHKEHAESADAAAEFLKSFLIAGPKLVALILRAGDKQGLKKRKIHHVANELGVIKTSEGFGPNKKAYWELP